MLLKILGLLSARERFQAGMIFLLMVVVALLDAAGVASIMPFVSILSNPTTIANNHILSRFYSLLDFTSYESFLLFAGIFVFALLMTSLSLRALLVFFQMRFSYLREYTIGRRLIEYYLNQPYEWFFDQNTGELGKSILSETNLVIANAILPGLLCLAQFIAVLFILSLLIFIDPSLVFIGAAVMVSAYGLIYMATRVFLENSGIENVWANKKRFGVINEAFGAIKEIKLLRLEKNFIDKFSEPSRSFAYHQANAKIFALLPRYFLETLVFGGMLLIVLYLSISTGDFQQTLPKLTLYAFAGYKLMPAMQQIYSSLSLMKFSVAAVENLHRQLGGSVNIQQSSPPNFSKPEKYIGLEDVHFTYPNSSQAILRGLSINIPVGSSCGIVGTTGVGKTTTIDLLLGLLRPTSGHLRLDGKTVSDAHIPAWQSIIGYVPQKIYLTDDDIASNIAFGINKEDIDFDQIEKVARIAQLHEFVFANLADGYNTVVGDNGVRLSGGQRQRIGIARALYRNPDFLVLDEATAALDEETEERIMGGFMRQTLNITLVVISHQKRTLGYCDKVFSLNSGRAIEVSVDS